MSGRTMGRQIAMRGTRLRWSELIVSAVKALLVVAALAGVALGLRLNPASAGFLLLFGVLLVGSRHPLPVATLAALAATLCYNFFFFPPTRTFVIEDPENWIALAVFFTTSLLANRLLVRERKQAEAARSSGADVAALYDLSFALLKDARGIGPVGEAAAMFIERTGAVSGGLILFGASPQHQQVLAWSGVPMSDEIEDLAAGVGRHGRAEEIPSLFGFDVCLPLMLSGRPGGVLVFRGGSRGRDAHESAANLLAFAIERERFMEERAHLAALKETNELKTSLLQAVSHDLKSPLTVLAVESEALARNGLGHHAAAGHVRVIRDEVARLHRRIDNLLSIARLEAGMVHPSKDVIPAADLFRAARESLPTVCGDRRMRIEVEEETPDLLVDPALALEIVVNLIENADRASPPEAAIELRASLSNESRDRVWIEVCDRGAGLPAGEARRVKSLDSADARSRGLGIELARTLAVLNGGSVEWFGRPGGGTVARLDLPAAPSFRGDV